MIRSHRALSSTCRSTSFPLLDRTAPQVVAVDVQQVEGVIHQPVRLAPRDRVLEEVEMGDAAIVGHGDLAIDDQLVPGGSETRNDKIALHCL